MTAPQSQSLGRGWLPALTTRLTGTRARKGRSLFPAGKSSLPAQLAGASASASLFSSDPSASQCARRSTAFSLASRFRSTSARTREATSPINSIVHALPVLSRIQHGRAAQCAPISVQIAPETTA